MKLIELYSLASGLKIGKQALTETIYPLDTQRYITLQSGSGMAAKNYPYYSEVTTLLAPILNKAGIAIVQLGGKDDPPVFGCKHLQGNTTLYQSNYILSRALCHFGNDSWMSHRAGEVGVKQVILFGSTTPQNHGPYRFAAGSAFLESHRFGKKATFASNESPSTISVIPPEDVANAVLRALDLPDAIQRKSWYIGPDYNVQTIELIPDVVIHPDLRISCPIFIRMDYHFDERAMANNLILRGAMVMTNREIDLNLLTKLKSQIALVKVEVDKVSPQWILGLKKTGIKCDFYSAEKDPDKLSKMRLDYYEACFFDQFQASTREDFLKFAGNYQNKVIDPTAKVDTLWFRTNKAILSNGKVFLSKAHWLAGQYTESTEKNSAQVIDTQDFWEEVSHQYVYQP